jgi:hypothetical protein
MNGFKKMWYTQWNIIQTFKKKNEIRLFAGKWMKLEIIMLCEVNQAQKDKVHMLSFICRS